MWASPSVGVPCPEMCLCVCAHECVTVCMCARARACVPCCLGRGEWLCLAWLPTCRSVTLSPGNGVLAPCVVLPGHVTLCSVFYELVSWRFHFITGGLCVF